MDHEQTSAKTSDSYLVRVHLYGGHEGKFYRLKVGNFLKAWRQIAVQPQVVYTIGVDPTQLLAEQLQWSQYRQCFNLQA